MKIKKFNFTNPQPNGKQRVMPDITHQKILMGFWHNWAEGFSDGYQQGSSIWLNLTDVPVEYNVVAVAFMKGSGIPTFSTL